MRLDGRTCFVTGAGQGIGHAVAARFAQAGALVIAADRRFQGPSTDTVRQIALDVTDGAAVLAAARAHGGVDVLVNCVGYVATGALLECTDADFDRSLDVNVRSMMLTCRAFLPAMLERGRGSIVNIASVVSSVMAAPDRFAYATSKAAVVGLTMAIARDYVARGIRCNALSPGTVDSPALHQRWAATGAVASARAAVVARPPRGRGGRAEEIAAVALLLASDEGGFVTGTNMIAAGGMSL